MSQFTTGYLFKTFTEGSRVGQVEKQSEVQFGPGVVSQIVDWPLTLHEECVADCRTR